ncbi:hypothetical protein KSS87_013493 [Heliosperma pusillum]|nr:hypothetical protein KSS87_013493 [Heliosperma pusillum]
MPDEVIVHILSFMSTADAVRTMLIRRFGSLWTLVPTLTFDIDEVLEKIAPNDECGSDDDEDFEKIAPNGECGSDDVRRFCIFVRNVLILHKRHFIDKFYLLLACHYDDERREASDDIIMWLKFALDKQAKEIYFSYLSYDLTKSSDFPNFTSQSLVTLELCNCTIYPQLQVNLGSLKKLILDNINEKSDDPWGLDYLNPIRELDFPNLKSLDLEIDRIPDVVNVSSVQDVYLNGLYIDVDDEDELGMLKIFLEKFSCCEVIHLSCNASEPFLHSIDESHRLQMMRWKRVELGLRVWCQSCLWGVYQLMRSSKDLEELTIHTTKKLTLGSPDIFFSQGFHARTEFPPKDFSDPCEMSKLKTVTIHGYAKPWEHQLQLIEFLLKNATILEKLVIVPNQRSRLTAARGSTAAEKHDHDFVMHGSNLLSKQFNSTLHWHVTSKTAMMFYGQKSTDGISVSQRVLIEDIKFHVRHWFSSVDAGTSLNVSLIPIVIGMYLD